MNQLRIRVGWSQPYPFCRERLYSSWPQAPTIINLTFKPKRTSLFRWRINMHDSAKMNLGNGTLRARKGASLQSTSSPTANSRNVPRGIWELARLHTREAWLCWYPAGVYDLCWYEIFHCHDANSLVLTSISLGSLFISRDTERDFGLGNNLPNSFRHME